VASVDYSTVTCDDIRAALSARLDGEETGLPDDVVDDHLAGCAACVAWREAAQQLDLAVRMEAVQAPDLAESIMQAVDADPLLNAQRARLRAAAEAHSRRQILRVAVAAAAIIQLALALPTLFGVLLGTSGVALHASREMASFDVAVAVGFLLAAYRPQRALAYVPVALVLAGCLAVTSGIDLARGATGVGHEVGHLVAVVQAGLLWALGRVDRSQRRAGLGIAGPVSSVTAAGQLGSEPLGPGSLGPAVPGPGRSGAGRSGAGRSGAGSSVAGRSVAGSAGVVPPGAVRSGVVPPPGGTGAAGSGPVGPRLAAE
jgi:predicted anti-sigma-YlaC factor YlaD